MRVAQNDKYYIRASLYIYVPDEGTFPTRADTGVRPYNEPPIQYYRGD